MRASPINTRDNGARFLLILTVVGIIAYWGAVFSNTVAVSSSVPGYVDWFMAFPLADAWIAAAAAVSLVAWKQNPRLAGTFLVAAGSGLIFLSLNAFLYGYRTGLLFELTTDELIEIAIKIYCLTVGSFFILTGYARDGVAASAGA